MLLYRIQPITLWILTFFINFLIIMFLLLLWLIIHVLLYDNWLIILHSIIMISNLNKFLFQFIRINLIQTFQRYLCKHISSFSKDYFSWIIIFTEYFGLLTLTFIIIINKILFIMFIFPISIQYKILINKMRYIKTFQYFLFYIDLL